MKRIMSSVGLIFFGLTVLPMNVQSAEYKVDTGHTYVTFNVMHLGIAPNYGRFNVTTGVLNFDVAGDQNTIKIEIDAASVDTANRKRDKHLRADDFFDVKQFPKITFVSTAWKKLSDTTYSVTGDLVFHGVKTSKTVTVTKTGEGPDPWGNERIGFTTSFQIDRFLHGVNGSRKTIGQFVNVMISLEAKKTK